MQQMTIDGVPIGPGLAPLVIAEIGVNHDGSFDVAMRLIEAAKAAGAGAIKFQLFRAERLMHRSALFAKYQELQVADVDPAAMLKRYELDDGAVQQLVDAARERSLLTIATPFSIGDMPLASSLNLSAIKIASPDLVNKPLLKAAATLGKPMLVSCGAATLEEVARTYTWLTGWGVRFAFLHCISSYPTPDAAVNLSWIREMSQAFDVPIGYSDHATDPHAGALAVAAGAVLIEKHLTYDCMAKGPDHAASADPAQFEKYVAMVRKSHLMMGKPVKRVLEIEADVRTVSRQSLVVARNIAVGERIAGKDLITQRPGTGVSAAEVDSYIGRVAKLPLTAGAFLDPAWLEIETDPAS